MPIYTLRETNKIYDNVPSLKALFLNLGPTGLGTLEHLAERERESELQYSFDSAHVHKRMTPTLLQLLSPVINIY